MAVFLHPFTCTIAASSGGGKTVLCGQLLRNMNTLCDTKMEKITIFYKTHQPIYDELSRDIHLELSTEMPNMTELRKLKHPQLIVIDDALGNSTVDKALLSLAVVDSHHSGISVITLTQNLFHSAKRTTRINQQYLLLMKNPSDKLGISTLARQLFPSNPQFLVSAYEDATEMPFTYLLLALHPQIPDKLRVMSRILPDEGGLIVYRPVK